MKSLRDALIAGATIALLLYVAMTAAKSMAGILQPPLEASARPALPVSVKIARRDPIAYPQLARRDD